eukprot:gnl/TRDRNA2_/TRDRNA2_160060_c0_seq2.p1 gnl/TRDRNA2_/TRDRNA2_160060_c0~~gnl/TRDRNA2_/TRDRNA2_160060_c0_seq2.p1  ORF type:complete len:412 (+),score=74.10 gnl/TRDRNA2_/TRDRNA2_160060_c0_seq2:86-1237(+)
MTWHKNGSRSDGALLAGAIAARFLHVDMPAGCGQAQAKFVGGFDEFIKGAPSVEPQAYNLMKKCPGCGKPCAVNMKNCNNCNTDLTAVAESKGTNLFVGMIFGIDKVPFPLKISLRSETPSMMVFDDPLAITRAHVLAVPTHCHCPDVRSLFVHPAAGLKLITDMDQAAWDALKSGHLASDEWRKQALSPEGYTLPVDDLRPHVVRAFNLPPSQYQIHMQYMLPPLLPSHLGVLNRGGHFVKLRHFPVAYVQEALQKLVDEGKSFSEALSWDASKLVEAIANIGLDYEAAHKKDWDHLVDSNNFLANFDPADFEFAVLGDKVVGKDTSEQVEGAPSTKDLDGADKLALQGYGRPYVDGKPSGMYYKYAREQDSALPAFGPAKM